MGDGTSSEDALRARAIDRLRKRRAFFTHLIVYAAVNALLVVVWAFGSQGFFWPIFPIVAWGIFVIVHAYKTFSPDVTEEERVGREMDRLRKRG